MELTDGGGGPAGTQAGATLTPTSPKSRAEHTQHHTSNPTTRRDYVEAQVWEIDCGSAMRLLPTEETPWERGLGMTRSS